MKVAQVNLTYKIGSTGKIVSDIDIALRQSDNESLIVCGYCNEKRGNVQSLQSLSTSLDIRKDILISRVTGTMGYRSKRETKKALQIIDQFNPDVVHLHNIHGDYINVFMLFDFLSEKKIPVVWTLHDCWAFTGRCSYFEISDCQQWKVGCDRCSAFQKKVYPITYLFDSSDKMWKKKKNAFTKLEKVLIVTPSQWLAKYVEQSYLSKYPIRVINNGINIENFYYTGARSISSKKILLGVALSWSSRKGLDDFIKINEVIDHEKYQICLVGLNDRQYERLPYNIIKYKKINSVQELIKLYSDAAVFINPTYQDNYPTVNLEALACGTKVVTYNTGGSPESIKSDMGIVVEKGDFEGLLSSSIKLANEEYDKEKISAYARRTFDMRIKYDEYIQAYKELCDIQ